MTNEQFLVVSEQLNKYQNKLVLYFTLSFIAGFLIGAASSWLMLIRSVG
jgi:hypothetical protein